MCFWRLSVQWAQHTKLILYIQYFNNILNFSGKLHNNCFTFCHRENTEVVQLPWEQCSDFVAVKPQFMHVLYISAEHQPWLRLLRGWTGGYSNIQAGPRSWKVATPKENVSGNIQTYTAGAYAIFQILTSKEGRHADVRYLSPLTVPWVSLLCSPIKTCITGNGLVTR